MWLHFPRGGAATPDISVAVQPAGASYFRRHSALVEDGDGMGWVSASGVEGVESLILDRLTGDRVALVFAEPNPSMGVGGRVFDIHIGGRLVESAFDIVREAGGADRGIRRSYDVEVGGALIVELKPARDSAPALLCGVEVTSSDLRAPLSITYPTASSTGVYTVAWTAVLGAESYRLVRSSDGGRTWESVYTGPATSYTEAAASGNHRYRVRAQNSAGRSRWRTGTVDGVVRIASIDPVNARSGAQGGAADAERLGSGSGARESAQAAGAEPLPAPDQAP